MSDRSTIHLLCGLNGAGKTTYARRLAEEHDAVRFSLDEWLLHLHPDLRFDAPEYGPLTERCKELISSVARQVLAPGHDVILDWNGWSRARHANLRRAHPRCRGNPPPRRHFRGAGRG